MFAIKGKEAGEVGDESESRRERNSFSSLSPSFDCSPSRGVSENLGILARISVTRVHSLQLTSSFAINSSKGAVRYISTSWILLSFFASWKTVDGSLSIFMRASNDVSSSGYFCVGRFNHS